MERWNCITRQREESKKADAFIAAIKQVCIEHKLCIMHEDTGGAFIIADYSEDDFSWFGYAQTEIK